MSGVELKGRSVVIGAMSRHADVAASQVLREAMPALASVPGSVGDPQVRNRGTIGGSIANNDPAADYPAAVVALNATVTTNSGKHTADSFFKGLFETALGEGEIITSVSFPKADKAAYMKFPNPASRYAMVGVFVAKSGNNVRVAVTGAGACVFRVKAMEDALAKNFSSDAIKDIKIPADALNSDIHGSAEYRAHLVNVMARRAVDAANK
jgi:carbon-monoxide dehydrogenase medium subunit